MLSRAQRVIRGGQVVAMQLQQERAEYTTLRTRVAKLDSPRQTITAVRSLERFGALPESDILRVQNSVLDAECAPASSELVAEGTALARAHIVLSGWAARVRFLSDGRRQIVAFLLPGDFFGHSHRIGAVEPCPIVALTSVTYAALVDDAPARTDYRSALDSMLSLSAAFDEIFVLNQLVRVGRQTAYERLAHLLLELFYRLKAVSHAQGNSFVLPLTQETLSDALGLSVVHTNRTLQQLRRDRLIETKNSMVVILQADRLAEIADFKPPVWPNAA